MYLLVNTTESMKKGDKVFWLDPEFEGGTSGIYTIIDIKGDVYSLKNDDSECEAYEHELKPLNAICVCGHCGSLEIQEKWWINPNTKELIDPVGEAEYEYWCGKCEKHFPGDEMCNIPEWEVKQEKK